MNFFCTFLFLSISLSVLQSKGVLSTLIGNSNCRMLDVKGLSTDEYVVDDVTVKFHLTTKSKSGVTYEKSDGKYVKQVDFDTTKRTVIIVHGSIENGNADWTKTLADAYLQWGDINAFVVEWTSHSHSTNYVYTARETRLIGNEIANFVSDIIDNNKAGAEITGALHLLGHSLGAHIIGVASREMKRRSLKWQASRLTGLDPAQPCFTDTNVDIHLEKSDAPFVDIIHTSAKAFSEGGLGMWEPTGHLDFYPNGGKEQPGCPSVVFNYGLMKKVDRNICSHNRAYEFFTDSLKTPKSSCSFLAFEWNPYNGNLPQNLDPGVVCKEKLCVEMGINAENFKDKTGSFYIKTALNSPFCKVEYQVTHWQPHGIRPFSEWFSFLWS